MSWPIEYYRRIETERELTDSEERSLVALLKCQDDDDRRATAERNLSDVCVPKVQVRCQSCGAFRNATEPRCLVCGRLENTSVDETGFSFDEVAGYVARRWANGGLSVALASAARFESNLGYSGLKLIQAAAKMMKEHPE